MGPTLFHSQEEVAAVARWNCTCSCSVDSSAPDADTAPVAFGLFASQRQPRVLCSVDSAPVPQAARAVGSAGASGGMQLGGTYSDDKELTAIESWPASHRTRLQALPCEEFEGVLHPVFEEDEWKLIAVGGLLGLWVGAFQAVFVFGEE